MDAISSALARLLEKHDELAREQRAFDARLARLEKRGVPVPDTPPAEPPFAGPTPDVSLPPPLPTEVTGNPVGAVPVAFPACDFRPYDEAAAPLFNPAFLQTAPAGPERPALETKVGLTVANRVGVITLVLGVAFFFKWAVDNDWIGPGGRVLLGVLAAFVALAAADFLWRKGQRIFAQGVTGSGIAILYLSIYAAYSFYGLIVVGFAFELMFITTAMAVTLALRYSAEAIAALGLLGGYLTPLLLSTGEDRPWFYLSYLLVLNLAAMRLALKKNWRGLETLSFGATVVLYLTWISQGSNRVNDKWPATLGALIYSALFSFASQRPLFLLAQFLTAMVIVLVWPHSTAAFFLLELFIAAGGLAYAQWKQTPVALSVAFVSFWIAFATWNAGSASDPLPQLAGITAGVLLFLAWLVRRWNGWWSKVKLLPLDEQSMGVLVLGGAVYYAFVYALLKQDYHGWLGLLALAVAGAYLGTGALLRLSRTTAGRDLHPALLCFGIALAFITLAIPIQFHGFTVTMVWSLEGAALTWIGARLASQRAQAGAMAVFGLAAVRLLYVESWMFANTITYALIWNPRFLTFVVVAASLWLAAWWGSRQARQVALVEYLSGHFFLLWGLSLEVIAQAERTTPPENLLSAETVSISILLAIYAVVLVGMGVGTRTAVNRIAGLTLIGLVIVKLYLFDVWQVERIYRIYAFVALGILLIGTSFLYSHFRRLIEGWWKKDEAGS